MASCGCKACRCQGGSHGCGVAHSPHAVLEAAFATHKFAAASASMGSGCSVSWAHTRYNELIAEAVHRNGLLRQARMSNYV